MADTQKSVELRQMKADEVKAIVNQTKDRELDYIDLPVPVLNPYMYKYYRHAIAKAAGLTFGELTELMYADNVYLDLDTGKVVRIQEVPNYARFTQAVAWLVKKNSPDLFDDFFISTLSVENKEELNANYNCIRRRCDRYLKQIEMNAPKIITVIEAKLIQETVDVLFFGETPRGVVQLRDGAKCLMEITDGNILDNLFLFGLSIAE